MFEQIKAKVKLNEWKMSNKDATTKNDQLNIRQKCFMLTTPKQLQHNFKKRSKKKKLQCDESDQI
jgi:hypothetical protein